VAAASAATHLSTAIIRKFPMRINHFHETIMLVTVSALAALAVTYLDPFQTPRQATLLVEKMCCDMRAGDAAKELRKVAGVTTTRQSIPEQQIQITVHGNAPVLHASLWNAALKAKVRPVKLIVNGRVITQHSD
jgi:hypothetical protein